MARLIIRWFGVVWILIGVFGFVPGITVMGPPEMGVTVAAFYGHLFGLIPVNIVHDIAALLIGGWGVWAASSSGQALTYARIAAIIFAALAVAGFIPSLNTVFGLLPLFGAGIWPHALAAVAAAYVGWYAPAHDAPAA